MPMTIYEHLEQGTDEWRAARCGLLTASEMKHIITPKTMKFADNDTSRGHVFELAAQRITKHVEPHFVNDDMLRGIDDEPYARDEYAKAYGPVKEVGFITNDRFGYTLGFSPDGLVGSSGIIEIKSRRAKHHLETIVSQQVPNEHMAQIQTGLLVSEREWCDYVSYCGGLPMVTIRVPVYPQMQQAIIEAAKQFHLRLDDWTIAYQNRLSNPELRLVPTERRIMEEMYA